MALATSPKPRRRIAHQRPPGAFWRAVGRAGARHSARADPRQSCGRVVGRKHEGSGPRAAPRFTAGSRSGSRSTIQDQLSLCPERFRMPGNADAQPLEGARAGLDHDGDAGRISAHVAAATSVAFSCSQSRAAPIRRSTSCVCSPDRGNQCRSPEFSGRWTQDLLERMAEVPRGRFPSASPVALLGRTCPRTCSGW